MEHFSMPEDATCAKMARLVGAAAKALHMQDEVTRERFVGLLGSQCDSPMADRPWTWELQLSPAASELCRERWWRILSFTDPQRQIVVGVRRVTQGEDGPAKALLIHTQPPR